MGDEEESNYDDDGSNCWSHEDDDLDLDDDDDEDDDEQEQKQDVEEQEEEQRQRSSTATASDESWETDMEIPTSPPKSDFEVVVDEKESAITQDSDEDVKIIDTDISAVASNNTADGNVTDENELL